MLRKKRVWLGIAISVGCLFLVFRSFNFEQLGEALSHVNPLYILPAVAVYFVGVWLRAIRWQLLLRPVLTPTQQASLGTASLFRVLVVGFTVNNLLPARLGEVARAYLLWRGGRVEPGATVATIILERVLDGLTLLLFAGLAALLVPFPADLQRAALATAAVFLTATVGLVAFLLMPTPFLALATRILHFLPERFASLGERLLLTFVQGLGALRRPRLLAAVLLLSVLAWTAEAGMYYVVMLGFPFPARAEAVLLGAAAANIGTMIPSSPGYVGTFHLPLQIVLTQVFAVLPVDAASYTLVLHAALIVPVTLLGLFFVWQDWRAAADDDTEDGDGHGGRGNVLAALRDITSRQPSATSRQPGDSDPSSRAAASVLTPAGRGPSRAGG